MCLSHFVDHYKRHWLADENTPRWSSVWLLSYLPLHLSLTYLRDRRHKTTLSYKNSGSCVLIWTCCETELGCQLQRRPNNCMSTTQDMAHSFVDQAKLLSTNHVRVLERNMAGIALQECRFELWENKTWKDLAGHLIINQIIIYLGLETHRFINYQ